MRAVTQWEYWFEPEEGEPRWVHNHISSGHSEADQPLQKFPLQEWWAKATWRKSHKWLNCRDELVTDVDVTILQTRYCSVYPKSPLCHWVVENETIGTDRIHYAWVPAHFLDA